MLYHLSIAVHDVALRTRLVRVVRSLPNVAEVLVRPATWSGLLEGGDDVVVVERDLVPGAAGQAAPLRARPEGPRVVVLVAREDAEERARLLAAGCEAVLYAGLPDAPLLAAFRGLLGRRGSPVAGGPVAAEPVLGDMTFRSGAMRPCIRVAERVVDAEVSLLIQGETGTGKEWLARAIHAASRRRPGPFVAVNCGALPETLLESELFGHQAGAFTGATRSRRGWFELAHGGTIFLDEIGEMPLHLQVRLLRVLQDHTIQPIGGERSFRIDVRVMASTNRDLLSDVERGRFRRDLYYRLSPVTLVVPPLRERREDIPDLAARFLVELRRRVGRPVEGIADAALGHLVAYAWPGNVRELINVLERAVLLADGPLITPADLPGGVVGSGAAPSSAPREGAEEDAWCGRAWRDVRAEALEQLERRYLSALLAATGGRIGETARRAGMTTRSLHEKMRRLGLSKAGFRLRRAGATGEGKACFT